MFIMVATHVLALTLSGQPIAAPAVHYEPYGTAAHGRILLASAKPSDEENPKSFNFRKLFESQPARRRREMPEIDPLPERSRGRSSLLPFLRKKEDRPSDALLTSRCRSILYADSDLARSSISVSAQDGKIVLQGMVVSAELRRRAESLAGQTEGVAGVDNRLRVDDQVPQWFQHNAVTLAAPQQTQVRRPTGRATIPAAPTKESAAAPSVVLGSPRIVQPAPDLPLVQTYRIRRNDEQSDRQQSAGLAAEEDWRPSVKSYTVVAKTGEVRDPQVQPTARFEPASQQSLRPNYAQSSQQSSQRRDDLDRLFAQDPRAAHLTYRLEGSTVLISGLAGKPTQFYEFVDRMMQYAGVERIRFDDAFRFAH